MSGRLTGERQAQLDALAAQLATVAPMPVADAYWLIVRLLDDPSAARLTPPEPVVTIDVFLVSADGARLGPVSASFASGRNVGPIVFTDLPAGTYTHVAVGDDLVAFSAGPKIADDNDTLTLGEQ